MDPCLSGAVRLYAGKELKIGEGSLKGDAGKSGVVAWRSDLFGFNGGTCEGATPLNNGNGSRGQR